MARLGKTMFVEAWWAERLKAGRQLENDYEKGVRPRSLDWKRLISTQLLWLEFEEWMAKNNPMFSDAFNKVGFFTIFYRVSGAKSTYMRSHPVRYTAVRFKKLEDHKSVHAEKTKNIQDKGLVEREDHSRLSA